MRASSIPVDMLSAQEVDLGRRRFQNPKPFREGPFWKIRVYEDALDANGRPYRARPKYVLGPCIGPYALTERQAQKEAADSVLRTLNNYVSCPNSVITLEQFVTMHFEPKRMKRVMKHAGQQHYRYCLTKILPSLGKIGLRNITPDDIWKLTTKLQESGLSTKTVSHIKTAVATIINFAKKQKLYSGDNPAYAVELPETVSAEQYAYSIIQAQQVLSELESPILEAVLTSVTTTLNVAELCGLRWKRVNLTEKTAYSAGEAIPPFSALVRENYYRNRWGTVKTASRRRIVGLPDVLVTLLARLQSATTFQKPDDPIFSSGVGTPIDAHNTNNRVFKRISTKLELPVSWHIFRHSAATFMEAMDMQLSDRIKLIGHARAEMTQHYTHSDVERRRETQNKLAALLLPDSERLKRFLVDVPTEGPKQ